MRCKIGDRIHFDSPPLLDGPTGRAHGVVVDVAPSSWPLPRVDYYRVEYFVGPYVEPEYTTRSKWVNERDVLAISPA